MNTFSLAANILKSDDSILKGWHKHFSNLAAAQAYGHSDTEYMKLVQKDLSEIIELCKESSDFNTQLTKSDLYEIICELNRGKSPDVYGLAAEHFLYGGDNLLSVLHNILQSIIQLGKVPDCLKMV